MTLAPYRIISPRKAALLLSLLVTALGAFVLTGWALDIAVLKNVLPGLVTMKANTALGMLLCGAALALLSRETVGRPIRIATAVMAVVVIALGALSLAEYLFGWNLGIDQWLFRDVAGALETSSPGRMGPPSAFCFVLAGIALAVASQPVSMRLRLPILSALGAVIFIIGGLNFVGRVSEALLSLRFWNYAGIAIHTAMGFVLLGCALLAVVRSEGGLTWSLDTLTTSGFVIGILSLLVAAGGSYRFTSQLEQSAASVSHTQEILKEIRELKGDMADLQGQQRGYIITGDERLLKQRGQTKVAAQGDLGDIRRLTADNPNQQSRLDRIEPLIAQRNDFGEQTIAARRQQGFPTAQQMIATGQGIVLSDKIDGLLKEIEDEEYTFLDRRQNQTRAISNETFLILPLGVFLSLTILSLGLFFLNAGMREREQSEKELANSEAHLRAIFDNMTEAIVVLDRNKNLIRINAAGVSFHGLSDPNAPYGQFAGSVELVLPNGKLLPPEQWPSSRALRGEFVHNYELGIRRRDTGKTLIFEFNTVPITNEASETVQVIISYRDITERKKMDESRSQLAAIVESSDDAIIGKDLNSVVTSWNAGATKLFGYTAGEMVGHSITCLIPPDRQHEEEQILNRIKRGEIVEHMETVRKRKDGQLIDVSVTVSPIKDAANKVVGASKIARNITERKRAEERVARSEAEYRELFEEAPYGVYRVKPDGTFVLVNNALVAMLGYESKEDLLGKNSATDVFFDPAERARLMESAQPGGRAFAEELKWKRKDGDTFKVRSSARLVRDVQGNLEAVEVIAEDITERKRAEVALRESEATNRALLESSGQSILAIDRQGKILFANATAEKSFGYGSGELIGQTVERLLPDSLRDRHVTHRAGFFAQPYARLTGKGLDLMARRTDGTEFPVEIALNTIETTTGALGVAFITDITKRKHAEEALRLKAAIQEQLSNVIATVPGAVFSFQMRPDGTAFFPFASSRFQDIFNLPAEDLKRDAAAAFAMVHPDDLAHFQAAIMDSSQRLTPLHEEFRVQHSERGTIWAEINSLPVRQPDDSVLWHGFATDITERKTLESQFRQSQKMEAVGQLTGGVAHDFNNLLGVILGNLDLLERLVADNEAATKRVQTAQKAALRGADLTKRLLAFSSRQHLNPAPTWLDASIQNMMEMASRVLGPEIKITTSLDKSVPPVLVDAAGLENVLLNLAVNARDAMPKGGSLTISTGLSDLEESYPPVQAGEIKPGRYARVTVSDTGQGMSRETLQRVFEPFFTTKPRGKGTGLGLAMVYGFVKQSGGIVRIYSEVGQGTTVTFYLPLAEGVPLLARAVDEKNLQAKAGGTVLVVDDEVDLLEVAVAYAEEMGYRVLHATDAASALAVVAREPRIELLVTDVIMPGGMNGVELSAKVRQLIPGLKVIYSSGFPSAALNERSGTQLDAPLLTKPYHRNEFVAAIRREMGSGNAELAGDGALET